MNKNICITLQYDGGRYDGWQKQGNTEETIQGRLEAMLSKLFEQDVEVQGSGRTDAGVHAVGQVANFHVNTVYGPGKIVEQMNRYLPKDIVVTDARIVDARFHARLNAKRKTYRYRIGTGFARPVFGRQYLWYYPAELSVEAMRQAAAFLLGEHDFTSFCGNRHRKKSNVRTIESITIEETVPVVGDGEFPELVISVTGNGFLQNMVRIIVGTLVEIGEGKRPPEQMGAILAARDREQAGATAPAHGLTLWSVEY
ncbi:MAG: tRNA pseudouridine(38-40) synthase TruA [Lachnospiraceae bacterium]|nr:tRNA pseudouridine(38-40) synthase TruA [Lachnospiraceae bacterium]